MADIIYNTSNAMMRQALRTFSKWQIEGLDNVPPVGPLLVVANHLSNIDPPLLAASIPRRLYFIAKWGLFKPFLARFVRAYGALPTSRDGNDRHAFQWMRRLLNEDQAVVVFPEAHRNPKTGMQRAVPGMALLALRTQAPILPVGIIGTDHIVPAWRVPFPTGEITVNIGPPLTLPSLQGPLQRPQLDSIADMIMYRIAELLPEHHRGIYNSETHNKIEPE